MLITQLKNFTLIRIWDYLKQIIVRWKPTVIVATNNVEEAFLATKVCNWILVVPNCMFNYFILHKPNEQLKLKINLFSTLDMNYFYKFQIAYLRNKEIVFDEEVERLQNMNPNKSIDIIIEDHYTDITNLKVTNLQTTYKRVRFLLFLASYE